MDAAFWRERWDSGRINFNQANANMLLTAHWSKLACSAGSEVFVPLCGKTIDMIWLKSQGHCVIGNELSARAITDFFSEQGLIDEARPHGRLTVHTTQGYELWCGDFFDMPAAALAGVEAVYDRASLIALPTGVRQRYAAHMTAILPIATAIFLIAFEYDEAEMDGPPFSVTGDEIATLYGSAFDLELVANREVLEGNEDLRERGLTHLDETLVILRRNA